MLSEVCPSWLYSMCIDLFRSQRLSIDAVPFSVPRRYCVTVNCSLSLLKSEMSCAVFASSGASNIAEKCTRTLKIKPK